MGLRLFVKLIFIIQFLPFLGRTKVRWVLGHLYNSNSTLFFFCFFCFSFLPKNTPIPVPFFSAISLHLSWRRLDGLDVIMKLIFLMQLLLFSGWTKVRWVLGHLYNHNSSFCSIPHLPLLILARNTHIFRSPSSPCFYVIHTVQHISCAMCLTPLPAPHDHPAVVHASPRHPCFS
jgi:hypothetical protein